MREVPLRRFQILEVGNDITQNRRALLPKKDGWMGQVAVVHNRVGRLLLDCIALDHFISTVWSKRSSSARIDVF